jgi:tetratricopeptide (TPR) repeat protein
VGVGSLILTPTALCCRNANDMTRSKFFRPGLVLAAISTSLLLNSFLQGHAREEQIVSANSSADRLKEVDRLINAFELSEQRTPTSSGLNFLGGLLLQRARISGESTSLVSASQVSDKALEIAPTNAEAQLLRAKVLYTNHQFSEAAEMAKRAVSVDPKSPEALTSLFDATLELGEVESARKMLRSVEVLVPNAPALLVRQARLAFLTGKTNAAAYLAKQARRRAPESGVIGSDLAFYSSFAGQVAFDRGDILASEKFYSEALQFAPGDRGATFGLARAIAASGDTKRAISLLEDSVMRFPDPVALGFLGDLQTATGATGAAQNSFELVEATASLAKANHQIFDRQITMFLADHNLKPTEALRMAQAELLVRHDVYAYDTLAWAAFRAGDLAAAKQATQKALAFGTQDAAIFAHAGLIAAAADDSSRAFALLNRSLAINPHFSVSVAALVRAELNQLSRLTAVSQKDTSR